MAEPKGPRQEGGKPSTQTKIESEATKDEKEKEVATEDELHEEPGTQEQDGKAETGTKGTVVIECVNITNLAYNWDALADRVANVIFVQENKLKGKAVKKTSDDMDEAGWQLLCGPCDDSKKKPNAGVGVLARQEGQRHHGNQRGNAHRGV